MVFFCTFFDYRYLDRGLALYRSLVQQGHPFHLWILCMDSDTHDLLARLELPGVSLVTIDDLARQDKDVLIAKGNRSLVEFYFTSKSFLISFILSSRPDVELITYLDADLFFFSSPAAIKSEMEGYSVGLTPHRFPPRLKERDKYGTFNAGFISFRRDADGLACLEWWRNSCFAWCHDYVSGDRFADQRYLDAIPASFAKVKIISHKGINAAPWNISQYETDLQNNNVLIAGQPLVLYHFHDVKQVAPFLFESGLSSYHIVLQNTLRRAVYLPYIEVLRRQKVAVSGHHSKVNIRITKGSHDRFKRLLPSVWKLLKFIQGLVNGVRYRSLILYAGPKH